MAFLGVVYKVGDRQSRARPAPFTESIDGHPPPSPPSRLQGLTLDMYDQQARWLTAVWRTHNAMQQPADSEQYFASLGLRARGTNALLLEPMPRALTP